MFTIALATILGLARLLLAALPIRLEPGQTGTLGPWALAVFGAVGIAAPLSRRVRAGDTSREPSRTEGAIDS